jgi:hypothetical protein
LARTWAKSKWRSIFSWVNSQAGILEGSRGPEFF